ncbi:MAG TPA: ATP-binding protein [Myxococcota bacterium]|jgi:predicted AAA+ superfamily ATPase|nr:ATP-binding protein [Myxococcota bacterium]
MRVSLPVVSSDRSPTLLARLARLLDLAERALVDRVGAVPDPELFERYSAFRWEVRQGRGRLVPIAEPDRFSLDDLVGVERPLARLVSNTEQFLAGLPANHVLLFGERGTGKSSAVKGLLARYAPRGLRVVEVHKDDLLHLPDVLEALHGRDFRFLIFCDDLSFDAGETGYRALKAALEGSLVATPTNVRIVATSNRRHLLPQSVADNREARLDEHGDLHMGESVDEKLALSDRFGLMLGFYAFDQRTYLEIVDHYAKRAGLEASREQIHEEALRWALVRSSRSGRTAKQFVDDFAGRERLAKQDER